MFLSFIPMLDTKLKPLPLFIAIIWLVRLTYVHTLPDLSHWISLLLISKNGLFVHLLWSLFPFSKISSSSSPPVCSFSASCHLSVHRFLQRLCYCLYPYFYPTYHSVAVHHALRVLRLPSTLPHCLHLSHLYLLLLLSSLLAPLPLCPTLSPPLQACGSRQ